MSSAVESLDFKLDSPEVKANPYPVLRRLREEDPVHYVEQMDCWLVSRYKDIYDLYTDPRVPRDDPYADMRW